jgi:hypothetical protein
MYVYAPGMLEMLLLQEHLLYIILLQERESISIYYIVAGESLFIAYVSSYCYMCVLILLHVCPRVKHTLVA